MLLQILVWYLMAAYLANPILLITAVRKNANITGEAISLGIVAWVLSFITAPFLLATLWEDAINKFATKSFKNPFYKGDDK